MPSIAEFEASVATFIADQAKVSIFVDGAANETFTTDSGIHKTLAGIREEIENYPEYQFTEGSDPKEHCVNPHGYINLPAAQLYSLEAEFPTNFVHTLRVNAFAGSSLAFQAVGDILTGLACNIYLAADTSPTYSFTTAGTYLITIYKIGDSIYLAPAIGPFTALS